MATATGPGSDSNVEKDLKLSEIFDNLWKFWGIIEKSDEPTNSAKYQETVKKGYESAERAVFIVNELRLFSDNEELEEVATNEMRYLLLSAMLGYFQLKIFNENREAAVSKAKHCYLDFLRLCKCYGVSQVNVPELDEEEKEESGKSSKTSSNQRQGRPDLAALNAKRQQKIARFKEQKELEKTLFELKSEVEKEHVDDEVKRQYHTTLLKKWINSSLEELESIRDELEILEHMSKMKVDGKSATSKPENKPPPQPLRPFILTKTMLQKKVFGAGYPSLPTYTIEEYYDQQVALGNFPDPSDPSLQGNMDDPEAEARAKEQEDIKKETDIEKDDPEALQKARNWDDWKDDHRTGWGNTHNKG